MPKRIQRKRTKGWRMPPNTVYVGRPSKWGNPVNWKNHIDGPRGTREGREIAVLWFERWVDEYGLFEAIIRGLRGKNLACWCPLDQPCHADYLLKIANRGKP